MHVDDLFIAASREWMEWAVQQVEKKFGKVRRQSLPLVYCGIHHQRLGAQHLFLSQNHYLEKVQPPKLDLQVLQQMCELSPENVAEYRRITCSLLWTCLTRLDIAHDVVLLHSTTPPTTEDMKTLIALLVKAKEDCATNGLHYRKLSMPTRILVIANSGHNHAPPYATTDGFMVC